jgi:DNA-directed RNA polymerase specialized sigma24 family protein
MRTLWNSDLWDDPSGLARANCYAIASPYRARNMNRRPDASQLWSALVGVVLVAVGVLVVPGTQAATVIALVGSGASFLAIAAVLPKVQELEISPKGMRAKLASMDPVTQPRLIAEAERMTRLARMTCGDPLLGRELVEEAITKTKQQGNRIARDERGSYTLRTLLDLLETAPERRWLRDRPTRVRHDHGSAREQAITEALRQLEFLPRVCFLLRSDWGLPVAQVATVVGRSITQVQTMHEHARRAMTPHIDGTGKAAHGQI